MGLLGHYEREGDAIRPKDKGRRTTMCGLLIGDGGCHLHPGNVVPLTETRFICSNCAWVMRVYRRRARAKAKAESEKQS